MAYTVLWNVGIDGSWVYYGMDMCVYYKKLLLVQLHVIQAEYPGKVKFFVSCYPYFVWVMNIRVVCPEVGLKDRTLQKIEGYSVH